MGGFLSLFIIKDVTALLEYLKVMKMASLQANNHQNSSVLGFIVLFSNAKKAPLEVSRKQHRKK